MADFSLLNSTGFLAYAKFLNLFGAQHECATAQLGSMQTPAEKVSMYLLLALPSGAGIAQPPDQAVDFL
ncbi:MAG: hypothetical protein AB8B60_20010 [Sulfitobacter sp.]